MSHSHYCICCKERSDLVSVHEELSLQGYICSHNSAAALVDHCFNIKILTCEVSYAMCSTCVRQVIQSCIIKDQLVNNLNSSKDFKEEINVKDENNMEIEIAEETFLSDSEIKDEYTADTEIKSSHELEDVFDSDNKVSSDDEESATQPSQTEDDTKLESCHEYEDVFNSDNSVDDPSFMSDHEKSVTKKPHERAAEYNLDKISNNNVKSNRTKKIKVALTKKEIVLNKNESTTYCKNKINAKTNKCLTKVKKNCKMIEAPVKIATSEASKMLRARKEKRLEANVGSNAKTKSVNVVRKNDFDNLLLNCKDFGLFSWYKSKYKCLVCNEVFPYRNLFKNHSLQHTSEDLERVFLNGKCDLPVCLKVDISSMKCRHCGDWVKEMEAFRNHLSVSHSIQADDLLKQLLPFNLTEHKVKCGVCDKDFVSMSTLNMHMNEHSTNYICPHCGKFFISLNRLRSHKNNMHATGTFKCTKCDETFESNCKRNYHIELVHSTRQHLCPHCPETFKSSVYKSRHLAEAHNEELRKYKCETCPAAYITGKDLNQHIRNAHLQERNHSCSECGVAFFNSGSLKEHMVIHTGERTFECQICRKTFARRGNLRQHMRVHNR